MQLSRKYDDLLLAKYVDGPTAWHVTAWCGYKDILEEMWGWGTKVQLNL